MQDNKMLKYEDKILQELEKMFKKVDYDIVRNYSNGTFEFLAMNKLRDSKIHLIFNHPDKVKPNDRK